MTYLNGAFALVLRGAVGISVGWQESTNETFRTECLLILL